VTETHLILGGSGFIGRHVALRLAQSRYKVIVADRIAPPSFPDKFERSAIEYVAFDLQSADWDSLIARADIIHHYLWTTTPQTADADPRRDLECNVGAIISLLQAIRRHNGKRILFSSSGGAVYGRITAVPVTEDHPLDPISAYGAGKAAAEKYIAFFRAQYGVDARIARLANPYGAGQDPRKGLGAVNVFLDRALRREPISIWGDGSVVRDYIHISDVTDALLRLSRAPVQPAVCETAVFNIGSGEGRSLNQIVNAIRTLVEQPVVVNHNEARPFDVPVSVLDISRAKAILDWNPILPFEEGLVRTHADLVAGRTIYSTIG
jgi:UDP-glucose 4-epimerase